MNAGASPRGPSMKKTTPAPRRPVTSAQRFLTAQPRGLLRSPPAVPSDLLLARPGELTLVPPWTTLVVPASRAAPTCAGCGAELSWSTWTSNVAWLPLGDGLFSAICGTCRQRDALFKDGSA